MRNPNPIRRGLGAVLLALLLSLTAACGGSTEAERSGEPDAGATGGTEAASYPMELTSPYGTTTLTKRPERVVVVGPEDVTSVIALGVVPVAAAGWYSYADEEWPEYFGDVSVIKKTLEPTKGGVEPEEVLKLTPDLIIAVGGLEGLAKGYDDLARIAPVVTYPEKLDDWAIGDPVTTLRTIARPLDKAAEAEALIKEYEDKLTEVRAAHPEFEGKTLSMVSISDGTGLFLRTQSGSAQEKFFSDLGFAPNPAVAGLSANATLPEEKYDLVNADILVTHTDRASTDESIERLRANPLWARLDAVKNGATVHLDDSEEGIEMAGVLSTPSLPSMIWMLDTLPDLLAPAAKAADGADG